MRFGIDLDGVLADFGSRVVQIGNDLWPGKFPEGYVPDNWNYVGYLSTEEWARVWTAIEDTPDFWLDEKPLPGVEELQNFLELRDGRNPASMRDQIFFITARKTTRGVPPGAQSAQWLSTYGLWPRQGYSTVIQVEDAKHKADLFRALKLRYMLDDYAPTVEQLSQIEGLNSFCLDQLWNREAKNLTRVYSVAQYLDTIAYMERYGSRIPVSGL